MCSVEIALRNAGTCFRSEKGTCNCACSLYSTLQIRSGINIKLRPPAGGTLQNRTPGRGNYERS